MHKYQIHCLHLDSFVRFIKDWVEVTGFQKFSSHWSQVLPQTTSFRTCESIAILHTPVIFKEADIYNKTFILREAHTPSFFFRHLTLFTWGSLVSGKISPSCLKKKKKTVIIETASLSFYKRQLPRREKASKTNTGSCSMCHFNSNSRWDVTINN